jgi:hypothetical protein
MDRYCILFDDNNQFYTVDMDRKSTNSLKLSNIFNVDASVAIVNKDQFEFANRKWLDGLDFYQQEQGACILFISYDKSSLYIVNWSEEKK